MFKPTKLLRVISIIMIVFGVISLISMVLTQLLIGNLDTSTVPGLEDTIAAATTPVVFISGIVSSLVGIAMGILGVMGKGFKIAVAALVVWVLYIIYGIISAIGVTGFQVISLINFIIPILYGWGLYQSKE